MVSPFHVLVNDHEPALTVQVIERAGTKYYYAFSSQAGQIGPVRKTREEAETDIFNYKGNTHE